MIKKKSDRDRIRQRSAAKKAKDRAEDSLAMEGKKAAGLARLAVSAPHIDAEWLRQMEMKVEDTRDYTGRAFGDPIPGDPRRPWLNRTASI